jgi:DNA-binding XRE family transcriptional regulator
MSAAVQGDLLTVPSSPVYTALSEALAKKQFYTTSDSPWPTAIVERDGAVGIAQLRPIEADEPFPIAPARKQRLIELMWTQCAEVSDLDADVLDMLSAIWLAQARTPNDLAVVTVAECLRMRGLIRKLSGTGRRGGFSSKQREELLYALGRMESTWLKMTELEPKGHPQRASIESRAFMITPQLGQMRLEGRTDIHPFMFRPGDMFSRFMFGPGRQISLLSAKAIQYDYYRHRWEKRLTRYLSWWWRINATAPSLSFPLQVMTLLGCVGEAAECPRFPGRVRKRLEKALDTLKEDAVISNWQYGKLASKGGLAQRRNWYPAWTQWMVEIEPPQEIQDSYKDLLGLAAGRGGSGSDAGSLKWSIGDRIRDRRQKQGLSQTTAAEQLGIDRSLLSRIEQDKRNPSQNNLAKIECWLEEGKSGDGESERQEQVKADHAERF